jgi:hypothetical protein
MNNQLIRANSLIDIWIIKMPVQAKWSKLLDVETLQRSSQALSVVDNKVYVFGGELRPREPRDNVVHVVSLDGKGAF